MAKENDLTGGGTEGEIEPVVVAEGGAENKQDSGTEGTSAGEVKLEPKPAKVMPEWVERRFGQLTAEKHAARGEADNLRNENASLKEKIQTLFGGKAIEEGGKPAEGAAATPAQPVDIEKLANARAEQKLAIQAFNKACNEVAEKGAEKFEDFKEAVSVLNSGYGDVIQKKPEFLQTIVELPNAEEVYYSLGKDPQRAERILALPPVKMALELGKISSELGKTASAQVSGAPAPIRPINGLAGKKELTLDDASNPDVPIQEFMRIREKELAEKRGW